jgi:hypothetical protein
MQAAMMGRGRSFAVFSFPNREPKEDGGRNATNPPKTYRVHLRTYCARATGANVLEEPPVHDYGADHWADRVYGTLDLEGHLWWFTERVRNPPGE